MVVIHETCNCSGHLDLSTAFNTVRYDIYFLFIENMSG